MLHSDELFSSSVKKVNSFEECCCIVSVRVDL